MVTGGGGEDGGAKLSTPFHHSDLLGQHPPGHTVGVAEPIPGLLLSWR